MGNGVTEKYVWGIDLGLNRGTEQCGMGTEIFFGGGGVCAELWQQNRHYFAFHVTDIFGVQEVRVGVADLVAIFLIMWKQI